MTQHLTNRRALAAAFTEWDRRYREDPAAFADDYQASSTAAEYGERAADYLLRVLRSQGGVATAPPWAESGMTPAYVHDLVTALITGQPVDFSGAPVAPDVAARLQAAVDAGTLTVGGLPRPVPQVGDL
jgi:hypothetical protein